MLIDKSLYRLVFRPLKVTLQTFSILVTLYLIFSSQTFGSCHKFTVFLWQNQILWNPIIAISEIPHTRFENDKTTFCYRRVLQQQVKRSIAAGYTVWVAKSKTSQWQYKYKMTKQRFVIGGFISVWSHVAWMKCMPCGSRINEPANDIANIKLQERENTSIVMLSVAKHLFLLWFWDPSHSFRMTECAGQQLYYYQRY